MLQLTILGNVGGDPQTRTATNGAKITTFSVGVSQGKDNTFWVSVVVSGTPKVCEYIRKGRSVFVQGNMDVKVWNNQPSVTLFSQRIELVGKGDEDTNQPTNGQPTTPQSETQDTF